MEVIKNYAGQKYAWSNISDYHRYFYDYGYADSGRVTVFHVPYGNLLMRKHVGTFRIKK